MKQRFLLLLVLCMLSVAGFASAQTLRVDLLSQDDDPVLAGDVVELRFKIENLWEDTKENVRVEIIPEYPFSLYSSSAVRDLGRLEGRRTASEATFFDFKLLVDPGAVDGEHEIDIIVHKGETYWKIEDTFFVDIDRKKILLKPYIVASDLITSGSRGKFSIEIANAGEQDAKSLELELLPSENYKLLSTSSYVYLGDLEADDTESEDFSIYVDTGLQEVSIPIKLNYQVNEEDYEETVDLNLNLLSEEEAKKVGLIEENYNRYIVLAVLVVVLLIVVLRRFKKR